MLMTIWQALILGIIQGATEFLPVSSSGHLVLFNNIFGISGNTIAFSVFLHLATLFAVFIILRKQIWWLIKHPFSPLAKKLYLSTAITVVIALIFESFFKSMFSGAYLSLFFMITAVLLVTTELIASKRPYHAFTYKTAIVVGLVQGIAVIPGISRSGSTICAGVLEGANREECAEFSFILSIPIIIGSMLFEIFDCIKLGVPFFDASAPEILIAFVAAFLVGLLCVKVMLSVVKKAKFLPFAIYLVGISIVCLFI